MITLQDLIECFSEKELARRTDRINKGDSKVIDMSVIGKAIDAAEGKVESYLNAVDLVARDANDDLVYIKAKKAPKDLIQNACDIARYYLYDDGVTPTIEKRYDDAIAWLKRVQGKPTMLTGVVKSNDNNSSDSGIHVIPNPVPNQYMS